MMTARTMMTMTTRKTRMITTTRPRRIRGLQLNRDTVSRRTDRLLFKAGYFRCAPGGLGALSNVMHDRQGVITELQRERPRGNRGAYMYEVKFDAGPRRKPSVTLDRLPARGQWGMDFDEDVEFLSEEL